jgi:hypothetical protein
MVFTQWPNETPRVTKDLGNGHIIRCNTQGMIPHPTDKYKYVICEYIWTSVV